MLKANALIICIANLNKRSSNFLIVIPVSLLGSVVMRFHVRREKKALEITWFHLLLFLASQTWGFVVAYLWFVLLKRQKVFLDSLYVYMWNEL